MKAITKFNMNIFKTAKSIVKRLRHLRVIDERQLYRHHEEVHLRRLLKWLQVDCIFDVGANRGQYGLMIRKNANYSGDIVSFEPIPDAVDALRKLSQRDDHWQIEEMALSCESGRRQFNIMTTDEFSSFGSPDDEDVVLFRKNNSICNEISVKTETLFDAYKRLSSALGFKRPFLKMDTQGFDVEVFRSGGDVVNQFVGIQSEMAIRKIYKQTVGFSEALDVYQKAGFELSAMVPNNAGTFPCLVEMDAILVRRDLMER